MPHMYEEMHIHFTTGTPLREYSRDLQQIQCKKKRNQIHVSRREDGFPVETASL